MAEAALQVWLPLALAVLPFLGGRASGWVPEARIVGGTSAAPRRWPWQVSLREKGEHVCGGSLIASQWVLTAAHCISSPAQAGELQVQLGESALYTRPAGSVSVAVASAVKHPGYEDALQGRDVALLRLARPVPLSRAVWPVLLARPGAAFAPGTRCWVTGWGDIKESESLPQPYQLQEVDVTVVAQDECRELYRPERIGDDMLCAGSSRRRPKGFCEGDSGGPLVCQRRDGTWVQAAVVSFSRGCAERHLPGVYARVSAFWPWIVSHLRSRPGPRG